MLTDYEAVKPSRRQEPRGDEAVRPFAATNQDDLHATNRANEDESAASENFIASRRKKSDRKKRSRKSQTSVPAEKWIARRGHALSFVGLFLFTGFVYFRPYEFISLPGIADGAQYLAILTLMAFLPSQLATEGNLTARPREVNLVLLLALAAMLSIPLAINPGEAWENFLEFGKVIVMFVVMVNVVRTEGRLRWMILLSLLVSIVMSVAALSDYAAGRLAMGGTRVKGIIGSLFENPNDMALHLVTMMPLAVCFALGRRGALKKLIYGAAALIFIAAIVVTFSRGGFLGLVVTSGVLAWKLARKNRVLVVALGAVLMLGFVVAAPNEYGGRLLSMFGGDTTGSADARMGVLKRSVLVALRYPLFGVGIGNFYYKSLRDQVSHNSYTQVASEIGMFALVVYCLFLITPLKRLRKIEDETLGKKPQARFYYLSVGLQASLVGFMVTSFFASVAYLWYVYYLVGYAVCLRRLYGLEAEREEGRGSGGAKEFERADAHDGFQSVGAVEGLKGATA